MYKTLSGPVVVQVEITTLCDLACIHCYNYWRAKCKDKPPDATLSEEALNLIADELIRQEVFRVVITGGEPLLFTDRALHLAHKLRSAGICVALNTNLTQVDRRLAERISACGDIASVLTSLMSFDEKTHDLIAQREGAYRKTVRSIKLILEAGVHLGINMVVTKINLDQVYETGLFVASLGAKAFSATKAAPPANALDFSDYLLTRAEVQKVLADLLKLQRETGVVVDALEHHPYCLIGDVAGFPRLTDRHCSAGVTTCTIGANGEIRPCSHAPMSYGNILEEGLLPAWQRMQPWRDGSLIPKKCWACKHLAQCSGGCRVEALVVNGALNAMDPHATGPEDVLSLPPKGKAPGQIPEQQLRVKVKVGKLLRREEPFGVIVTGQGGLGTVTFVSKETDRFLRLIDDTPPRSIRELQKEFGLTPKSVAFLWKLLRRGVLEK